MMEITAAHRKKNNRRFKSVVTNFSLTFIIPEGILATAAAVIEIENELRAIEEKLSSESEISSLEVQSNILEKKIQNIEPLNNLVPFFDLKLKDPSAAYKIGTTFLNDISKGHKHFGFTTLAKHVDDLHLVIYGSFINYSLKQSVLIVVRDINDKSLDQFRNKFTIGTLWKWKTHDWGNLCFIDYGQIKKYSEEFKLLDLDLITCEFSAVLWSISNGNSEDEMKMASMSILSKVNSVTLIVNNGETKAKKLMQAKDYYQCFNIPIKGILMGSVRS